MSDIMALMGARHSVRRYTGRAIPPEIREALNGYAAELSRRGGLDVQILYDEPTCFGARMARYGRFENCRDYIALAGVDAPDLEERCGYYGELLVLRAQALGLNTCWAALTHGKSRAALAEGEREVILIALGYGRTQGAPRKSKAPRDVSDLDGESPEWYRRGVEAALLAPTAVNQQKFRLTRDGNRVSAKAGRFGACLKIDLGIVKCHFELGAGRENFEWA